MVYRKTFLYNASQTQNSFACASILSKTKLIFHQYFSLFVQKLFLLKFYMDVSRYLRIGIFSDGCSVLYTATQYKIMASQSSSSSSVAYNLQHCKRSCPIQTSYVHHTLQISPQCTKFLSVANCTTHSEFSFCIV